MNDATFAAHRSSTTNDRSILPELCAVCSAASCVPGLMMILRLESSRPEVDELVELFLGEVTSSVVSSERQIHVESYKI